MACARMMQAAGVKSIIGVDIHGIVYPARERGMNPVLERFAEETNPEGVSGSLHDAVAGADVFLGVSAANVLTPDDVRSMNRDPIVFALANPDPEIEPAKIEGIARIIATGRSDYPNQINNVLCFPGLFRGVLDVRARQINERMKLAAAHAIANVVAKNELSDEYIIPSVFNRNVVRAVAREVAAAAQASGVAQRRRRRPAVFL
jgi:malate dehydrogenase (oxaloacetate-decarboxylating)